MKKENIMVERATKVVYKEDGKVIKLFKEGKPKSDILNEALNQARVEETTLNVPKLLAVEMIEGKWAIITEEIKGVTLQELMDKNPAKEDEYLNKFVDIQIDMYKVKCPSLNKQKEKLIGKLNKAPIDGNLRYDLHVLLESMPNHGKVCHGDYNPSNIILGDDGKVYIIDWAHATQGNASADVALAYLLFLMDGKEALAKKYINLYCEKSGTALKYVQEWISIIAATELAKAAKENDAKTIEFLSKQINVFSYM